MANFSKNHNRIFIQNVIPQNLLDQVVDWIFNTFRPEDIFPEQALIDWAEENGFVKAEEVDK